MIWPPRDTCVVRRLSDNSTAGLGYVQDSNGTVWKIMPFGWKPPTSGTTGIRTAEITSDGRVIE